MWCKLLSDRSDIPIVAACPASMLHHPLFYCKGSPLSLSKENADPTQPESEVISSIDQVEFAMPMQWLKSPVHQVHPGRCQARLFFQVPPEGVLKDLEGFTVLKLWVLGVTF